MAHDTRLSGVIARVRRFAGREVETAYGLALGFILNGLWVTAASAGVISSATAISRTYGFAGALGGLTMALIHFCGIAFAEEDATRRKVARAAFEALCAVVVGAIVASYFTPYAARWAPRVDPADLLWLAYSIGVFAWRAMPLLIEQLPRFIKGVSDAALAAIRKAVGAPS
jgi:cytochrome bd-type quinol oxidase subunit 2